MRKSKKTTKKPWIDPDDAPELTMEWFQNADVYDGDKLVRRGRGRPPAASKKVSIHLRVDPEVALAFRATGKGWQTRANLVLKHWVEEQFG